MGRTLCQGHDDAPDGRQYTTPSTIGLLIPTLSHTHTLERMQELSLYDITQTRQVTASPSPVVKSVRTDQIVDLEPGQKLGLVEPRSRQAYRITSSAWRRSDGGRVRPRAWAVLRLMTNSNFAGCSTGRSPGLVPFRILSTKIAARR